jgi:hypothetical protein
MKSKKEFDCVEMKRSIQEKIYEKIKDMTWEEERDYLRQSIEAGPLALKWKELQDQEASKKKTVA